MIHFMKFVCCRSGSCGAFGPPVHWATSSRPKVSKRVASPDVVVRGRQRDVPRPTRRTASRRRRGAEAAAATARRDARGCSGDRTRRRTRCPRQVAAMRQPSLLSSTSGSRGSSRRPARPRRRTRGPRTAGRAAHHRRRERFVRVGGSRLWLGRACRRLPPRPGGDEPVGAAGVCCRPRTCALGDRRALVRPPRRARDARDRRGALLVGRVRVGRWGGRVHEPSRSDVPVHDRDAERTDTCDVEAIRRELRVAGVDVAHLDCPQHVAGRPGDDRGVRVLEERRPADDHGVDALP